MGELKKILHVDDDPDIRTITLIALEVVGGFRVLQCASGQEALDSVVEFAPDLIILDVMMPGLDGEQTFHLLKTLETASHTPVIFMTAKAYSQSINSLLSLGAAGVITKPFDPMTLAQEVEKVWKNAEI